ncbi:MAG: porin [Burkholderiales bacterium]
MKKSLLALAVLGAFAGSAVAQSSVTLYGVADVNITRAKGGTNTLTSMGSGGLQGSRWGLRGSEDMGGGLKANFVLESGYAIDTGANLQGALFGRAAWVGLSGGFGEVRLGRQLTSIGTATDNLGSMATKGADLFAVAASTGNAFYRTNNAITYLTPNISGFQAQAQYSFGLANEPVSPSNEGEHWGFNATYAAGPIKAGVAYLDVKDRLPAAGNQKAKGLLAYGGMSFGAISVLAAYDKKDFDLAKDPTVYGLEVGAKFGAASVAFSVAKAKDTTGAAGVSDDATLWTLQTVYDMSNRTSLYAFYTAVSNGAGAALGYNTPALDKSSNQLQLGLRHRF